MESEAKALKAQAIHKKRPMNHATRQLSTVQTMSKGKPSEQTAWPGISA